MQVDLRGSVISGRLTCCGFVNFFIVIVRKGLTGKKKIRKWEPWGLLFFFFLSFNCCLNFFFPFFNYFEYFLVVVAALLILYGLLRYVLGTGFYV